MPVLRTDILEIAYADHGDPAGPAVVVVHGWPDAARGWNPVVDGRRETRAIGATGH